MQLRPREGPSGLGEVRPLVLRADASAQMGTGHVMRSLALAQAWQDAGGTAVFACANLPTALEARLGQENCSVVRLPANTSDSTATTSLARELGAEWVVVDGYQFDAAYQDALKAAGFKVLFIDDYGHARRYSADLVLNQNLGAEESWYRDRSPGTEVLLGPQFALLRREFWPYRGWRRSIPERAAKLLITLGGADPDNVTRTALQAVRQIDEPTLLTRVVVGGSNPHRDGLAELAATIPSTELLIDVNNMPKLMAWADVAIAAGGTTSWERCLLGLPSLVLVLAENQATIARQLQQVGAADAVAVDELVSALEALLVDAARREKMTQAGQRLVDGFGVGRVVEAMGTVLTLAQATAEHSRLIWQWANQPSTRSASFESAAIPWEGHQQWYAAKLADPRCMLLLLQTGAGQPIGMVRIDEAEDSGTISINLVEQSHRRGLGTQAIRLASRRFFQERPANRIHAYIRPDNVASLRAFTKAGYKEVDRTTVKGQPAVLMLLPREQA